METAQAYQKPDHSQFLTKLNYDTVMGEFRNMAMFQTDCFVYVFRNPMTNEQQLAFMEFIRDSEKLNNTTLTEFMNWFLTHDVLFDIMFKITNRNDMPLLEHIEYNWVCFKLVKAARKALNELYEKHDIQAYHKSLFFKRNQYRRTIT